MTTILDIHTHRLDATQAIISVEPQAFAPRPGKLYSVGHHPWSIIPQSLDQLITAARHPQVVAVGETGLDTLRGAPLEQQISLLEQHISIANELGKPVITHMVRTSQQLVNTWRKIAPSSSNLVVHGMRGNARVAQTLVDAGFYLSYGTQFNPAALRATPLNRILAETDNTTIAIDEVIATMARAIGCDVPTLSAIIARNTSTVLHLLTQ